MQFETGGIYHIYDRGNYRQPIFFREENYLFFLKKAKQYVYPNCDILAWCLMPNHFHFLIYANDISCKLLGERTIPISGLAEGIRLVLSSYCKAINVQEKKTGNLFQQKTKSKSVWNGKDNYSTTAFHYIHQNPIKAGLADRLEDWEYSSYKDYAGLRSGSLCNKEMAIDKLHLDIKNFKEDSYITLQDTLVARIF